MSNFWRVGKEELSYVEKAIDNGLNGFYTTKFEELFADKFNIKYAIAVNSGTSALHAALGALDIGEGDEVIVPPLTFIATAFSVMYVGAVPVFVDVDPNSFNICPEQIKNKITKKTKAIITVSLYGLPPQLDQIKDIAQSEKIALIEDNAQCIHGLCNKKIAGTFGDISIFSLQRSKHLTTGDVGIVTTNNQELAQKTRRFADLGYERLTAKPINNENFKNVIQHPSYKRHSSLGYNFRMPEVCCAMGIAQLEKMDIFLKLREEIAAIYYEAVDDCKWIKVQEVSAPISDSK